MPPYVLLPGNPQRVEKMARRLDDAEFVASNREYTSWKAKIKGTPVAIVSTGIGGPSAAIALEELVEIGCHTFIRTGTCGVLQHGMQRDDLIIATGSVRGGATASSYVPLSYPSIADIDVVNALTMAAKSAQYRHHRGIVQCKDAFYIEEPEKLPMASVIQERWEIWKRAGVLASEMESDTLFVIGSLRKVRVGSILIALGGMAQEGPIIGTKDNGLDMLVEIGSKALFALGNES